MFASGPFKRKKSFALCESLVRINVAIKPYFMLVNLQFYNGDASGDCNSMLQYTRIVRRMQATAVWTTISPKFAVHTEGIIGTHW